MGCLIKTEENRESLTCINYSRKIYGIDWQWHLRSKSCDEHGTWNGEYNLNQQKNIKKITLSRLMVVRVKTRSTIMWNKLHRKWELFFAFYVKNYLKVAVIDQNLVAPGSSFNVQDYNIGTEVRVPYKKVFNFLKKWAIIYTSCKFYNCLKLNIF